MLNPTTNENEKDNITENSQINDTMENIENENKEINNNKDSIDHTSINSEQDQKVTTQNNIDTTNNDNTHKVSEKLEEESLESDSYSTNDDNFIFYQKINNGSDPILNLRNKPGKSILKQPINTNTKSSFFKKDWFKEKFNTNNSFTNAIKNFSNNANVAIERQINSLTNGQGNYWKSKSNDSLYNNKNLSDKAMDTFLIDAPKRVRFSFNDITIARSNDTIDSLTLQPHQPPDQNGGNGSSGGSEVESDSDSSNIDKKLSVLTTKDYPTPAQLLEIYEIEWKRRNEKPISVLISSLRNQIKNNDTFVTTIDIHDTPIGRTSVISLSDLLSTRFGLENLNIENTGINDEELKLILHRLLPINTLTHLNIAKNPKCINAIKYISSFLKRNDSLISLNISKLHVNWELLNYLKIALEKNESLKILKIDSCQLNYQDFLKIISNNYKFKIYN